jgi:hypothetical protein
MLLASHRVPLLDGNQQFSGERKTSMSGGKGNFAEFLEAGAISSLRRN